MIRPVPFPPVFAATARRLMAMQGRDGLWGGFRMTPGESRDWVGAVAAFALAEAAGSGQLPPALAAAARMRATRAAAVLRGRERAGGGWGYNAAVPPDADSTAVALRLFAALGEPAPPASVAFLAAQGSPATGWATYGPRRSWDRWSQPCPEVDAAAALALASAGALDRAGLAALWRDRLGPMQVPDGLWQAYWWPGPGAATLAAVELWIAAGRPPPAPRLPAPAVAGMSALDALALAHAALGIEPAAGQAALARVTRRMTGPGRWPADAVLLAPPRFPATARGEASPEGRGVVTAAAALRALTAACVASLHAATAADDAAADRSRQHPPVARTKDDHAATPAGRSRTWADPAARIAADIAGLARGLGLSPAAARLAEEAAAALLGPLLGAGLPWPNPAVSNLARGWPVEFSARLDPEARPALRLAADLGDPRLSPGARARVGRASLTRGALRLELDPEPLQAALGPLVAALRRADPGERFGLWAGLDLSGGTGGAQPILKAYANLAPAGPAAADRLALAAGALAAMGVLDAEPALMRLERAIAGAGRPQQMGIALAPGGAMAAKVYWELPAHDPAATARLAGALDLTLPPGFGPAIPGLASPGDARRGLSGLAVRFDPGRGLRPELTLATQAAQGVAWRTAHESRALAAWAGGLGLSAAPAQALLAALRAEGTAPRSLHTLTLGPGGRLRAAVYVHADGWLSRRLAPLEAPLSAPRFIPRSPAKEECHVHPT